MSDMSAQNRYDDIARRSGLSEEVVRRVLRAAKESLAQSLKNDDRATLPGICTMLSEQRSKLVPGSIVPVTYTKIKAKASNAMETEVNKTAISNVENKASDDTTDENSAKLNIINDKPSGIRLRQINALL